jgi:aminoglycoside 6-adenylyltransferase
MGQTVSIQELGARVTAWAERQPNIRAILVVGSRARRDHPGDRWADLDLMLFATDFAGYLTQTDWLNEVGPVWVAIPHQTGAGDPEWLVLFEGGDKVDFIFYPVAELQRLSQLADLPGVYRRGYYTLIDKDSLAAQLLPSPFEPPPYEPPSASQFILTANSFWYGAVYVAKQIRRRELWVAKFRDGMMKEQLIQMIEWHAQAGHGWMNRSAGMLTSFMLRITYPL